MHRACFAEVYGGLTRRRGDAERTATDWADTEARGYDKGAWIAEAFATLRRHRNVVGAIWFHTRKEADWRIDSSRSSPDAFRTVMRDPNVRDSFR